MWPGRHEMNRDECRKCLRFLELDAYGSMVSVLRAQGPYTTEKQRLLQEIAKVLHVTNERHRAEVRRAVNDEKLTMIAEQLNGPNTAIDWAIEGRRSISPLHRLKARTAFTTLANSLSLVASAASERKPTFHQISNLIDIKKEVSSQDKSVETTVVGVETHRIQTHKNNENSVIQEHVEEISDNSSNNVVKSSDEDDEDFTISRKRKSLSPSSVLPPYKVLLVSPSSNTENNYKSIPQKNIIDSTEIEKNIVVQPSVKLISTGNINTTSSITVSCKEASSCLNTINELKTDPEEKTIAVISSNTINCSENGKEIQNENSTDFSVTNISNSATNVTNSVTLTNSPNSKEKQVHIENTNTHGSIILNNKTQPISINSIRIIKPEGEITNPCIKKVTPLTHSNAISTSVTKSIIQNTSHCIVTNSSGIAVSSGPGSPYSTVATGSLQCKKLSSINIAQQSNSKTGITLKSNKTINISHHANPKLTSKPNVIVIQKGSTKGITLSHAGKEVLGKVIMGGKKLCMTNAQNSNAINIVPHITINNGVSDHQTVTLLSQTNTSADIIKHNIKPGNTIVFNLRQDVIDKNKVLSQLIESSTINNAESKTVIQNNDMTEPTSKNNDVHQLNNKLPEEVETVIFSTTNEDDSKNGEDTHENVSIEKKLIIDSQEFIKNTDLCRAVSQNSSIPDDTINYVQIEDSMYDSEIDMFGTESRDIDFESYEYLVENEETVLQDAENTLLSINKMNNFKDSL